MSSGTLKDILPCYDSPTEVPEDSKTFVRVGVVKEGEEIKSHFEVHVPHSSRAAAILLEETINALATVTGAVFQIPPSEVLLRIAKETRLREKETVDEMFRQAEKIAKKILPN